MFVYRISFSHGVADKLSLRSNRYFSGYVSCSIGNSGRQWRTVARAVSSKGPDLRCGKIHETCRATNEQLWFSYSSVILSKENYL